MWIAQAEVVGKAAADMLTADEVLPYLKATIALLMAISGFLFWKWQASEKARDDELRAQMGKLERINERLTGAKEGDSRA